MAKKLVIVESPTKAKKLKSWLGADYIVESSVGHVRDLPTSDKDLPPEYKGNKDIRHCILIKDGFRPIYVPTQRGKKVISDLRKRLKDAEIVYLATDPDREGESISWHLKEALAPKVPVKRVAFNEVTKRAVEAAFRNARGIDDNLVSAQETRRVLDRLVGYEISPLLWRKIQPGLSAGRVQSVAVRLLVERERERMHFTSASYWDLNAELERERQRFAANLFRLDGKDVATTANAKSVFDESGQVKKPDIVILDETAAVQLKARLETAAWRVSDVQEQKRTSRPYEPFITDTLMAAANSRLGLSARDAMRVAQSLYENGWITYHRTDSPTLSEEGMKGARDAVVKDHGTEYLHPETRVYTAKGASAQEAHEAIRPAGESFTSPGQTGLKSRELALYTEIYRRTLASQMKDETFTSTTVLIDAANATFKATGKRIDFAGWRKAYGYDEEEQDKILPALAAADPLALITLEANGHATQPPARYTEGSLIKALKDDGVGRPSTYASIMETILGKGYAFRQGRALVPTFVAFAVTRLLEENFERLVDEGFTAEMERSLDDIAAGKVDWQDYLDTFWSGPNGLEAQVEGHKKGIDAKATSEIEHPALAPHGITLRVGRYGPYAEVQRDGETVRANIPPETPPADLDRETVEQFLKQAAEGPAALGKDPETGTDVYVLVGRFGPYVQLGEAEGKAKPPRASLPRDWDPATISLKDALFLLHLPKPIGAHPEGGKVLAGLGRFGPYVCREKDDGERDFRSLKSIEQIRDISLDEALQILAQPKGGRGAARAPAKALKDLGKHPETGKPIQVLDGRYGPYVKHEKTNATIPKETDPQAITVEEALRLLAEREAKGGGRGTRKRAAKKTATKRARRKPKSD